MCAAPLQSTSASGRDSRHLFIEGVLRALISGKNTTARTWPLEPRRRKHTEPTAPTPWCDYRSAMGSIRRPSETVVKKRRAVTVAFASALRELQASGVVARRAIADELNRRGVPTERNGRWHYTSVVRMLTRLVNPAAGRVGAGASSRQASLVRARTLAPLIRQIQSAGTVTPRAIAMELNARGIRASRGGKWHPTTVSRLLSRLQRPAAGPNRRARLPRTAASLGRSRQA
jgi:Recombinase